MNEIKESYLSINECARKCYMEREKFRELVKAFEAKAVSLPRRVNEDGKEGRCIPEDFLHIFEQAALYMRLENWDTSQAMDKVLQTHSVFMTSLYNLKIFESNTREIINLPYKIQDLLTRLRNEVRNQAEEVRTEDRRILGAVAKDQQEIRDAILDLTEINYRWQKLAIIAGILALGCLLLGFIVCLVTLRRPT